ncbi:TetR/AcrR family transcriptional regulator [Streptomyces sp. NBC_01508]|uniref:TetR/AcrR family transcriptional regulator n=1 Tax=Streptomyces sp. NBC_01508 TaxID=2903888 RepID=UPI00386C1CFF
MNAETGRRRYDSLRRAAQARETRAEIARAARELFVSRGWAETTVRDVAREAGVSVPTVYGAYGDKVGLVRALADAADLAADVPRMLAELEDAAQGTAAGPASDGPRRQLAAMAAYDRRLFERAGDVILLLREAGRTEPALAAGYREGRRQADETRTQVFSSWPDGSDGSDGSDRADRADRAGGVLRQGLDVASAVDVYAAMCNIDVYTTLTEERGWPPERVERWWADALGRELLSRG